jgi:hypothetical protein
MRKFLVLVLLGVFAVGCSSSKVNEMKDKVALKMSVAVEKELKEAYSGVEIVGVDCNAEAEEIGKNVYDEVSKFLKVKKSQKSAVSSLVPVLCNMVVEQVFPVLIRNPDGEYACLREVGSEKLEKVGKDLCNAIDL